MIERQGLIIWLFSTKRWRSLQRYGNLYYISHKLNYAIIYCHKSDVKTTIKSLEALSAVRKVEMSERGNWKMKYGSKKMEHEKREEFENIDIPVSHSKKNGMLSSASITNME